jgi:O-antigen/teichoic acid export membrane protein
VIGFASTGLIQCTLSYVICPFRPRFIFDQRSFQDIYRFARGIVGLPALTYVAFNIDVLVGSKLVPTDLIGMYGFALRLAQAPRDLVGRIVSPVLLPAFAEKQDDKKALCKVILKITGVTALFGIPSATLAAICGRTILSVVYPPKYSAVAIPFGLLCFYILFLIQATTLGTVLFGIGQPSKHRLYVGLRALILVMLIYPAIRLFGLTGAATALLLASFVSLCVQIFVVRRIIGLGIRDYIMAWIPGLVFASLVLAVVWFLKVIK